MSDMSKRFVTYIGLLTSGWVVSACIAFRLGPFLFEWASKPGQLAGITAIMGILFFMFSVGLNDWDRGRYGGRG